MIEDEATEERHQGRYRRPFRGRLRGIAALPSHKRIEPFFNSASLTRFHSDHSAFVSIASATAVSLTCNRIIKLHALGLGTIAVAVLNLRGFRRVAFELLSF